MDRPVTPLPRIFADAADLRSLARALGEVCLAEMEEIDRLRSEAGGLAATARALEDAIVALGLAPWHACSPGEGFAPILEAPTVADNVLRLEGLQPLAHHAALRAVCRVPLHDFFGRTWDRVELKRGDPVPVATRPTHTAFSAATPHYNTLSLGGLLAGTSFRLYGGPLNVPVRVALDFSDRDNLDAATWLGTARAGRFPIIESVHPYATSAELTIDRVEPDSFFGVRPVAWDEPAVLTQLRAVKDAGIAVMPELSLPEPAALAERVADEYEHLPTIVVGGSAHHDDGAGTRVNAGEVYLHGARLLSYRKVHPFRPKYLGEEHTRGRRIEDLAGPRSITIASGTLTRLAVVICADLNDLDVPSLLGQAGVNLLLVPSLTVTEGGFAGASGVLASQNQAAVAIVNGTATIDPEEPPDRDPFMVMVALPVPSSDEQVTEHTSPSANRRATGRIDLQAAPPPGVTWS